MIPAVCPVRLHRTPTRADTRRPHTSTTSNGLALNAPACSRRQRAPGAAPPFTKPSHGQQRCAVVTEHLASEHFQHISRHRYPCDQAHRQPLAQSNSGTRRPFTNQCSAGRHSSSDPRVQALWFMGLTSQKDCYAMKITYRTRALRLAKPPAISSSRLTAAIR